MSFSNNQVTYDWEVAQLDRVSPLDDLSYYAVAILSLDHARVSGNQLALRIRNLPTPRPSNTRLVANLLVAGATVDVQGNRTSESIDDVQLSMLTMGLLLNNTQHNLSTHCIAVFDADGRAVRTNNLTLLEPAAGGCTARVNAVAETARVFFTVMGAVNTTKFPTPPVT